MAVHIALLSIICILGAIIYARKPASEGVLIRRNSTFVKISCFLMFLVGALRGWSVGLDTENYCRYFIEIRNYVLGSTGSSYWYNRWADENGYAWLFLNRIVGYLTDNPQWLLAAAALIIDAGVGYFIIKNLEDRESAFWPVFFFVCLSYLYPSSMNLLRQFCAIAIGSNIYTVLKGDDTKKKKIIKSIILLIVSTLFHQTALLYIVVIIAGLFKRITPKFILISIVVMGIVVVLFNRVLGLMLSIFPSYNVYLGYASNYFESLGFTHYNMLMTLLLLICAILTCTLDSKNEHNQQLYILALFSVIAAMFTLLTTQTNLATRTGYYFDIFIILLIPKLVNRVDVLRKSKTIVYMFLFVAGWAFFIYELNTSGARGTVPYLFYWQ